MGFFRHHPPHSGRICTLLLRLTLVFFLDENTQAAQVNGGNLTVMDGDAAILPCRMAEHAETLTQISWKRATRKRPEDGFFYTISEQNGPSFANGPDPRITYIGNFAERDGTLQIANVSLDDEGSYTCIFSFFPIGIAETKVHLQLQVPPSTNLSCNAHILGNEEVLLATCTAAGARPPAEVIWLHQGDDFRKTTNYTSHGNGTVTMVSSLFGVPTREADGQKVECVVRSPALSRDHSKSCIVQVFFSPMNVTVVERSPNTIECVSEANPKPSFTWTRGEKSLPQSDIRVDGGNLTFVRWSNSLKGLYQCHVSNTYGQQNIQVYFFVATVSNPAPWVLFGLLLSLNAIAALWYFCKSGHFQTIRESIEVHDGIRRVPTESESREIESPQ